MKESLWKCGIEVKILKVYIGQPDNINERSRCQAQTPWKTVWGKAKVLKLCWELQSQAASTGERKRGMESQAKSRWCFTKVVMTSWKDPIGCLAKDIFRSALENFLPLYIKGRKGEGSNSLRSPTPQWFAFAFTTGINSLASRLLLGAPWVASEITISHPLLRGTLHEATSSGGNKSLFVSD